MTPTRAPAGASRIVSTGTPAPIANVAADTVLGAVPVAGDLFDAYWKANLRNIEILRAHLAQRR